MAKPGPKPLPSNVHLLRGNPSKKPMASLLDDFQPEVELPGFPSWTWPEAKKEWKRIGAELDRYGLVSKLDRAALVLYCQAWAKMVWAEQMLSRAMKAAEAKRLVAEEKGEEYTGGDGIMVRTANGNFTYSHHWVVGNKAAQQVKEFIALFGLSPSHRSGVSISNNRQASLFEEGTQDEWNAL